MVNIDPDSSSPEIEGLSFKYPFEQYSSAGNLNTTPLHFAHANGYPPSAYSPLLHKLGRYFHVTALRMRPLWPDSNPISLTDWRLFSSDLDSFLEQQGYNSVLGVGHSLGG